MHSHNAAQWHNIAPPQRWFKNAESTERGRGGRSKNLQGEVRCWASNIIHFRSLSARDFCIAFKINELVAMKKILKCENPPIKSENKASAARTMQVN